MEYSSPAVAPTGPFAKLMSANGVLRNEDSIAPLNTIYSGFASQGNASALFSHVQIFNPVGSGVIVIVDSILSGAIGIDNTTIRRRDTPLATDTGVWLTRSGSGANGLAQIRSENNVAILGILVEEFRWHDRNRVDRTYIYPFELAAGEGLLWVSTNANVRADVTFMGREI